MHAAICAERVLRDRKSTRLNSSHTEIYTLSLHDALPICPSMPSRHRAFTVILSGWSAAHKTHACRNLRRTGVARSEEHTSELQSHRDLHSFPTRRSSDLPINAVEAPRVHGDLVRLERGT